MKYSLFPFVYIALCTFDCLGQKDSVSGLSHDKSIAINYENDFFTGTDYYYTQGIRIESVNPLFRYSPVMLLLPQLSHSTVQYGLAGAQDCFTPTSITSPTILYGDEPFAGYIYLGHYKVSADNYQKQMLSAELDLGEIGPCAECEEEQKAIHRWFPGNIQPDGWQYQIGTGVMVNYKLRFEKALYTDTAVSINAYGQINAGTVYDNACAGFSLHIGKMQSCFSINHNPAFQIYGTVKVWVEGVGYNGTMQGALFTNNSVYTLSSKELNHIVLGSSYSVCLSYHKMQLEYSTTKITNEIIKGLNHGWGHIGITRYF